MEILCVAPSTYNDPFAEEWHPDLRYTVSFLRQRGAEAGFSDEPALVSDSALERCAKLQPQILFIEIGEETRTAAMEFVPAFQRLSPRTVIAVGGIPATLAGQKLLEDCAEIDLLVAGERDLTLLEMVERVREGGNLKGIAGLQAREWRGVPRALLPDLDVLGHMVHDGIGELLDGRRPEDRIGYVAGSRGCYASCSFCGVSELFRTSGGAGWRGRTPRAIVSEICELAEKFQIGRFAFQDDNFIGPGRSGQERAREIAAEFKRCKLPVEYYFCCRVNDVRRETFEELRDSGLRGVGISVESMNQESLNLLGKGLRADWIGERLEVLEELGIKCEVNLIFFDPYTTLAGVRRNLELLGRLRTSRYLSYSDAFPFNELNAFSWSRVAAALRKGGLLTENGAWRFQDPQAAVLAEFVRRLKTHIHCTFKKQLLFDSVERLDTLRADSERLSALSRVASGVRQWVGLEVLPRTVAAACDVIETSGCDLQDRLRELENSFDAELGTLREVDRGVSELLSAV